MLAEEIIKTGKRWRTR